MATKYTKEDILSDDVVLHKHARAHHKINMNKKIQKKLPVDTVPSPNSFDPSQNSSNEEDTDGEGELNPETKNLLLESSDSSDDDDLELAAKNIDADVIEV